MSNAHPMTVEEATARMEQAIKALAYTAGTIYSSVSFDAAHALGGHVGQLPDALATLRQALEAERKEATRQIRLRDDIIRRCADLRDERDAEKARADEMTTQRRQVADRLKEAQEAHRAAVFDLVEEPACADDWHKLADERSAALIAEQAAHRLAAEDRGRLAAEVERADIVAAHDRAECYAATQRADAAEKEAKRLAFRLGLQERTAHKFCPDCRDKVSDEACLRCQVQTARRRLSAAQTQSATMARELEEARAALREIKREQGKVCAEFELCKHVACMSSYSSWAIADAALSKPGAKEGE